MKLCFVLILLSACPLLVMADESVCRFDQERAQIDKEYRCSHVRACKIELDQDFSKVKTYAANECKQEGFSCDVAIKLQSIGQEQLDRYSRAVKQLCR